MTIICALHVDGGTWVGADHQVTASGVIIPTRAKKWVMSQDLQRAVGVCGDARSLVVLGSANIFAGGSPIEVATSIREILRADGHVGKADDDRGPLRYGNSFIYADPTGVWDIDPEFAVWRVEDERLWARGSGMDYALGADYAMRHVAKAAPQSRLMIAVNAAIENDVGCGGPVFVERLGG